jgi:hypothetical protein
MIGSAVESPPRPAGSEGPVPAATGAERLAARPRSPSGIAGTEPFT